MQSGNLNIGRTGDTCTKKEKWEQICSQSTQSIPLLPGPFNIQTWYVKKQQDFKWLWGLLITTEKTQITLGMLNYT